MMRKLLPAAMALVVLAGLSACAPPMADAQALRRPGAQATAASLLPRTSAQPDQRHRGTRPAPTVLASTLRQVAVENVSRAGFPEPSVVVRSGRERLVWQARVTAEVARLQRLVAAAVEAPRPDRTAAAVAEPRPAPLAQVRPRERGVLLR